MMIQNLQERQLLYARKLEPGNFYHRSAYNKISTENQITGIFGQRGVGKTSYLLHRVQNPQVYGMRGLYLTADDIDLTGTRLIDIAHEVSEKTDYDALYIDEIHKYKNWTQELKNIADRYHKLKVIVSGSSAIDITKGKYDLSRRMSLFELPGLSFREYLEQILPGSFPKIELEDMLNRHMEITKDLRLDKVLKYFNDYLISGYYTFALQFQDVDIRLQSIAAGLAKTIYEDISQLYNLSTAGLVSIEKIFKFIVKSTPGELNTHRLANSVGIDDESVIKYLQILRDTGLIYMIKRDEASFSGVRRQAKLLPSNTNIIHALNTGILPDGQVGKSREVFAVSMLKELGLTVNLSKTGDYLVAGYTFEIGGKGKTNKQIIGVADSYILADDILVGHGNTIPLYLMGFLY